MTNKEKEETVIKEEVNKELAPRITTLQYVENQIIDLLDKGIIYNAQLKIVEKTLLDPDKKEKALTAVQALQEQLEAGKASLKAWKGYHEELTNTK